MDRRKHGRISYLGAALVGDFGEGDRVAARCLDLGLGGVRLALAVRPGLGAAARVEFDVSGADGRPSVESVFGRVTYVRPMRSGYVVGVEFLLPLEAGNAPNLLRILGSPGSPSAGERAGSHRKASRWSRRPVRRPPVHHPDADVETRVAEAVGGAEGGVDRDRSG